MSFLLPFLPSIISAGAGIYGAYKENKAQKRAEKRGPNVSRISQLDPQQQQMSQLINSILTGQGEQPKGGLFGELFGGDEGFKAYSDPAIKAYHEQIVPEIAERFSGAGAGSQSSSAFQNVLARSGQDLATGLGQMRSQQRQSALSGLVNQYLTPRENVVATARGGSPLGQGLASFGGDGLSSLTKMLTDMLQQKFGSTPTIGRGTR